MKNALVLGLPLLLVSFAAVVAEAGNPVGEACSPHEAGLEASSGRSIPICETGAAYTNGLSWLCRHGTSLSDCDALDGRTIAGSKVDAYLLSQTHADLAALRAAEDALPLGETFWVSTHNTFNAAAYAPTLSGLDPNQQYSITDQLRMDARAIEVDVHWMPMPAEGGHAPMVCHATSAEQGDIGCTNERHLRDVLPEIEAWLAANPGEVVLIYVQDELNRFAQDGMLAHETAAAVWESVLGPRIYRPSDHGAACVGGFPLSVSRDDVLAAGRQLLLIGDCGSGSGWPALVHSIDANYIEAQWRADVEAGCTWPAAQYAGRWTRTWEDSTWVSEVTQSSGVTGRGDLLTVETVGIPVACGMNMVSLDQLQPDDGRLEVIAQGWADRGP